MRGFFAPMDTCKKTGLGSGKEMTRRRWIADEWDEASAVLLEEQASHLARVLRAQPGQQFDIVAGDRVRRGAITSVAENRVEFSLHEAVAAAAALPLVMILSIVRFERMEWAIEKLTELGVARIVPLIAQRSEKHLVQATEKRVERWRKIARESAQQSRRSDVPEISDAMRLPQWAAGSAGGLGNLHLVLSEREQEGTLQHWVQEQLSARQYFELHPDRKIYAAIGPEGGWTDGELNSFAKSGWQSLSLGRRVLRAETAAIAVASVLSSWLGE